MTANDLKYMRRALELAANGKATVSPNPMVGCVIVYQDQIIGEGWHQKAGEPHAEVNAVKSVDNPDLLKEATVYVTLEPCAHHGKTPPCADMLAEIPVKKVVIGAMDSNPLVAGKGVKKLEEAGIEVVSGVMAEPCKNLNKVFFTNMEEKRPYIVLKWAQTADGFIARENFDSKWISNSLSRQLVHKWRSEIDAILVGKNTAHYDNPQLTTRDWSGKNPTRLLLDHQLKVDKKNSLFDSNVPTIIFNQLKNLERGMVKWVKLNQMDDFKEILKYAYDNKIQSILVEGGARTLQYVIEENLWDEARVFNAPVEFGNGISAPQLKNYSLVRYERIKDIDQADLLFYYQNTHRK